MNISPGAKEPVDVTLELIQDNPYQMRTVYDESQLTALAESIRDIGLLQVPVARKVDKKYQLSFGHRRKRAFEQLYRTDWAAIVEKTMPLIVLPLTDREMFEICISENLKRADLSPIEKAEALKQYMDTFGATSIEAGKLFNLPESTVRGTVRLLKLPEEAKQQLQAGKISQTHARRILATPGTPPKSLEPKDGPFDLRRALMILLYDRPRSDVDDQLIVKKIRGILEENDQLKRQIELMNSRKRESAKVHPTGHRLHAGPVPSR